MAQIKTVRVATVKSTGSRYVVQQADFRTNVVHVWGEVTAYSVRDDRLREMSHAASLSFPLSDVVLSEVARTPSLAKALLAQANAAGLRRAPSTNALLAGALGNAPPALTALVAKALR